MYLQFKAHAVCGIMVYFAYVPIENLAPVIKVFVIFSCSHYGHVKFESFICCARNPGFESHLEWNVYL